MGSLVKIGEYINSRIYSKKRAFIRFFIFKSSKYYDIFFNLIFFVILFSLKPISQKYNFVIVIFNNLFVHLLFCKALNLGHPARVILHFRLYNKLHKSNV